VPKRTIYTQIFVRNRSKAFIQEYNASWFVSSRSAFHTLFDILTGTSKFPQLCHVPTEQLQKPVRVFYFIHLPFPIAQHTGTGKVWRISRHLAMHHYTIAS